MDGNLLIYGSLAGLIGAAAILAIVAWRGLTRRLAAQYGLAVERLHQDLSQKFAGISLETLSHSSRTLTESAQSQLAAEGKLWTQQWDHRQEKWEEQYGQLTATMKQMETLVGTLEKSQTGQLSRLATLIEQTNRHTQTLAGQAADLTRVLDHSQARGQWGERMAADILRVAGLVEGVHFWSQRQIPSGERPDFTFAMPDGSELHMEVKFPLQAFASWLQAESGEKGALKTKFLADAKKCIKETIARDYRSPESTIGSVLLFIPNEQVFAFLHQEGPEICELALKSHCVLCSPMSLLAILGVLHRSTEALRLQRSARDLGDQLEMFRKQWQLFLDGYAGLGRKIEGLQKDYGKLATTRARQLERALDRIIPPADEDEPSR